MIHTEKQVFNNSLQPVVAQQSPFPVGPWAGALLGVLRVAPIPPGLMSMASGWLGPQNGEKGP